MPRGSTEVPRMIPGAIAHPRSTVSFAQDVVTQFGAIGLSSIPANNRLILRRSSRLRLGSFATLSLARVSSSSRSSSASLFSSFSVTALLNQRSFARGLHQTRSPATEISYEFQRPVDFFKGGWSAQSCLSNASAACSLFSWLKAIFQEQLVQVYDASLEVIIHAIRRCTMTFGSQCTFKFLGIHRPCKKAYHDATTLRPSRSWPRSWLRLSLIYLSQDGESFRFESLNHTELPVGVWLVAQAT